MVKLIELLRNDQDDGDNSDFDLDNNEGDLFQEQDELSEYAIKEGILVGVRCAAHTLQLCVWEVLKKRMTKIIP